MARSDLNPILREMVADDTTTASIDWSWSCFHCHGASTGQNSSVVFCFCKTLKSTLYRRAFYASRRLGAAAACNLEYRKQRNDRTSPLPPHLQQTFEVPDDDDDRLRSSIQLRPTIHNSCYDCVVSASSSSLSSCTALSSLKSSRTHTFSKSSDANRAGCGEHPHKDNYTRCDNKSYNCHLSRVTSFCLCNRLHPNEMTSPDISQVTHLHHRNYHNQQQQQHRSRSDKGLIRCDIDNRTIIASYTRCKC